VFEEYQRWQRELERQPVEFLALERRLPALLDVARERLAGHLRVPSDDLALATNATSAVNAVARSLALEAGDEVLTTPDEYPGMKLLWEYVSRRTGASVVEREWGDLEPGLRTKAVFVSHVEWSTGRVNEVASLCTRARAAGALSIIDGAHAPGQLELDLVALGADVYAGNCHKWLCAPKGSGFLYARPEAQRLIDPLVISWDWGDASPFHQRHRWQGTRDPSALLAIPAALDFQDVHDWPRVRERCRGLLENACDKLSQAGLEPLADPGRYVQMLGFRVPTDEPLELKRRLYDEHRIEVPVFETRHGAILRVSVQGYNDEGDLDALSAALARTLRR
jgi:isopenicillin-N epimerase